MLSYRARVSFPAQFYFIDHVRRQTNIAIGSGFMAAALCMCYHRLRLMAVVIGGLSSAGVSDKAGAKWATIVMINVTLPSVVEISS